MKTTGTTKTRLTISIVTVLLVLTMLIGSTYAWFTDTATSSGNKIQAGNLDIKLEKKTETSYVEIKDGSSEKLFDYEKWEPGYSEGEILRISNAGTLALKYKLNISASSSNEEVDLKLAEVIDVYAKTSKTEITDLPDDFDAVKASNSGYTKLGTLNEILTNNDNDGVAYGVLLPKGATANNNLEVVETVYACIVLHMQEGAGNDYQGKSVGGTNGFYIDLIVTQYTFEKDSFDNQYDASAVVLPTAVAGLSYNGGEQALIHGGYTPFGTFKYAISDNEPSEDKYSETLPSKVNAGTYHVWYKSFVNNNDVDSTATKIDVIISKADQEINAPTAANITDSTVTLTEIDEGHGDTKYGYSNSNDATTVIDWKTEFTFEGLNSDTTYYFFAKYCGDYNYNEAVSLSKEIKTTTTCLPAGTQITMADGTLKNIEDIEVGDKVLSFNHESGEYEGQQVYCVYHGDYKAVPFTLHFDNGNTVSIVGEHDLFEKESLKYVTIYESTAEQFIGKHFYSVADGKYVELTDVTYETEAVDFYSIYVKYNENCIANGMLSLPDYVEWTLNYYEFNEDLTADLDVLADDFAKYGVYEPSFNSERAKYINISVGKGLITLEELEEVFEILEDVQF